MLAPVRLCQFDFAESSSAGDFGDGRIDASLCRHLSRLGVKNRKPAAASVTGRQRPRLAGGPFNGLANPVAASPVLVHQIFTPRRRAAKIHRRGSMTNGARGVACLIPRDLLDFEDAVAAAAEGVVIQRPIIDRVTFIEPLDRLFGVHRFSNLF
jgi:hypothetical protein